MFDRIFGKSKNDAPKDNSQWQITSGRDNGMPVIVRLRTDIPKWCIRSGYSHLLMISWPYDEPSGMPNKSTNLLQIKFEEKLDIEIERNEIALLTAIVTGNNIKEWQYYTYDPQAFVDVLNVVLPKDKPLPIQISSNIDSEWNAYKSIKDFVG